MVNILILKQIRRCDPYWNIFLIVFSCLGYKNSRLEELGVKVNIISMMVGKFQR